MTSPTGPSPERRTPGAFTLLELIAVLVLISTVLAIAAPALRGFVHGRQTADTAARILALTHLARSQAVSRGCVYRLNFDTDEGTYWLTVQRGGAFIELDSDHGREFRLPLGVSIKLATPSVTDTTSTAKASSPPTARAPSKDDEGVSYVQFYPDGRCDPMIIELAGGEGELLHITCPSASERFRIVSPEEDLRL